MSKEVSWLLISLFWLPQLFQNDWLTPNAVSSVPSSDVAIVGAPHRAIPLYDKELRFNVYRFSVTAPDTGRVRDVTVEAYRGESLLTRFHTRVDGAIVGAEVMDLDKNRFPELYVYSTSDGSGSFGRVYGWQFLPDRKADIFSVNWQLNATEGYMGHDSLWVEPGILCRKYPVYQPGDANAEPSGGYQMKRYHLQVAGTIYRLVAE